MKKKLSALTTMTNIEGEAESATTPKAGKIDQDFWSMLSKAALERDLLDAVDLLVIRALAGKVGRPDDSAFKTVQACLLATVKAGGLRIPLEPSAMAIRLEAFLKAAFPMDADSPSTASSTRAQPPEFPAPPIADADVVPTPSDSQSGFDPVLTARSLAEAFDRDRRAGAYAAVLGAPPDFLPLLQSGGGLYFQKHQSAEAAVGNRLAALLAAPDSGPPESRLRNILDTVLNKLPLRIGGAADKSAPMEFDAAQKQALELALRKRLVVISGGPGTGKTSLAANLLRAWTRAHANPDDVTQPLPRIRMAAPTGRAAQRLAESLRRSLESIACRTQSGLGDGGDSETESALDRSLIDLPCETLHRLLRYNPSTGEFRYRKNRPLPADLVLIDEVSMVDIFTLARLLDALPDEASLILLGDMDQLPSVEAGAVLADLVPDGVDASPLRGHMVLLERSHRSDPGILQVTRRINAMDGAGALAAMAPPLSLEVSAQLPEHTLVQAGTRGAARAVEARNPHFLPAAFLENGRKVAPDGGCRMLAGPWEAWLEAWVDFHYVAHSFDPALFPGRTLASPHRSSYRDLLHIITGKFSAEALAQSESRPDLDELFLYLDQARILTFTRKGWYGSVSVNRRVGEMLRKKWDLGATARRPADSGSDGFHGAPIMILENDHDKGLYNGDVGIQLRVQGRSIAVFKRAGDYSVHPVQFLPRHETAFAMTVHKSQGSEYDQVLLVLPEAGNRLLFKETLYTALTRAKYFAGIYGAKEVFLEAVGQKVMRESGLAEYLRASAASGVGPHLQ